MLLLRTVSPWLLLAFLGLQVSLSSAHAADKLSRRAQRSGKKGDAATGKGKFSMKNKMQCTWSAMENRDIVKLSVKCENPDARTKGGVTDLSCEYNAKPQSCPGYQSDPRGFWRQVGRALKKLQGKVCKEERALVKAGMCRRARREAHFKLDISSSVTSAQSGEPEILPARPTSSSTTTSTATTACTKRADHRKASEEYCSSSWASVCSFFFSMVQSEDC